MCAVSRLQIEIVKKQNINWNVNIFQSYEQNYEFFLSIINFSTKCWKKKERENKIIVKLNLLSCQIIDHQFALMHLINLSAEKTNAALLYLFKFCSRVRL